MIAQVKELTRDQKEQIAKWKVIINTYEVKGDESFSAIKVQKLLDEIQDFIRYGLPDHLFVGLKKVTDIIYEASLVLAEPQKGDAHLQKVGHLLYMAIKELCQE